VGVVLPWIISLFFYAGNQLNILINWSSALLFCYVNLLMPMTLYILQARRRSQAGVSEDAAEPWSEEAPPTPISALDPPVAEDGLDDRPLLLTGIEEADGNAEKDSRLLATESPPASSVDTIKILPTWIETHLCSEYSFAVSLFLLSLAIALTTLGSQISSLWVDS
jgi:hypothetical protein